MTRTPLRFFAIAIAGVLSAAVASASILAADRLIAPLSPSAERSSLQLSSAVPVDPGKPVWVSYKLLAVSASEKPEGSNVLDAALEGVPVAVTEQKVVFSPEKMTRASSAATIAKRLEDQMGQRTPEQLSRAFGPDLYAAYKALNEQKGSILEGTVLKVYGPTGTSEARLLASFDTATGMHPMLLTVAMGQGDVPAEYAGSPASAFPTEKAIVAASALLVAAFFWLRRRKQ